MFRAYLSFILAVGCAGMLAADDLAPSAADAEFFEAKIRPLLAQRCYACHSAQADKVRGGLRLDHRAGLLAGGESGPAIAAGDPRASLLLRAVLRNGEVSAMPPSAKLPDREIELLTEWLRRGAPFPALAAASVAGPIDWQKAREFWSFQPVQRRSLPAVEAAEATAAWPERRIDPFVQAARNAAGFAAAPPADRSQWIRRVTLDLTGLPPSPEQVAAFLADPRPDADELLVDRLLAAPQFGERWARLWLDLVRYADFTDEWQEPTDRGWLYRDWVVRAWNEDLPYDRFVQLQLAADLLPGTEPQDMAALGLWGLSPTYWKELRLAPDVIAVIVADEWEERVHTIGRTFLGLNVACARCHNHKFDPITAADYYALAGVVASTRVIDRPIIPADQAAAAAAAREQVKQLTGQIAELEKKQAAGDGGAAATIAEVQRRIAEIRAATPQLDTPLAHAAEDAALFVLPDGADATKLEYRPGQAQDLAIQLRGNPTTLGPVVPRRFLTMFSPAGTEPPPFQSGSGRAELAHAIVTDAAPLTARVIVNRVWMQMFGRGLVGTPSDFGTQGDRPTHPELLDDLAARFIASGWSLKTLVRELALSAAYRQSAVPPLDAVAAAMQHDPENHWLWRMNRKPLEIEPWRDAMLAASGELDLRIGGPGLDLGDANHRRRTLYGKIHRRDIHNMLSLFSYPVPTTHSSHRQPVITPLQQLFVLNSDFVRGRSGALASRLSTAAGSATDDRIALAYALLFARSPRTDELELARAFFASSPTSASEESWREYVQVLLGTSEFAFVD